MLDSDFAIWFLTEKDIAFLDTIMSCNYDYKLACSIKNKFVNANAVYSFSIPKYLPNFEWANTTTCTITNYTVDLSFKELIKVVLAIDYNTVIFKIINRLLVLFLNINFMIMMNQKNIMKV
jgi:hypothetical protein